MIKVTLVLIITSASGHVREVPSIGFDNIVDCTKFAQSQQAQYDGRSFGYFSLSYRCVK